jgi:hypothetical protein
MSNTYIVNKVVYVDRDGNAIQPVGGGWLKKTIKKIKKGVKKFATIKNIVGVVASVALPGVGGALVNAGLTATDIAKQKQQQKKAIKKAKEADAAAIKQVTDSFDKLKAESDKFRADRGLSPLNVTLPDLKTATPEMVEKAFSALQDDAAALLAAENNRTVVSSTGDKVSPSGEVTPASGTSKAMIIAGAALIGVGAIYFLTRKRH